MAEEFRIFARKVFCDDRARSEQQIFDRCDQIERELRTLLPAIANLKQGYLVRRLRTADQSLMVDFFIVSIRQGNFQFDQVRGEKPMPDHVALREEVRQLIESLRRTQVAVNLIGDELLLPEVGDATRIAKEWTLRQIMKQRRGQRIDFGLLQPDLDLVIPGTPALLVSQTVTRIRCRILGVGPASATASSVRAVEATTMLPSISPKQHYRLGFAAGKDNLQCGLELLTSAFRRQPVELDVRLCYEPVLNVVTDFLIE